MYRKISTTLFLSILFFVTAFGQFDKTTSYEKLESLAGNYYQNNNIDSAIIVMEYAFDRCPDYDENTSSFLGILYTMAGMKSKAISMWRYGIDKGYGYGLCDSGFAEHYKDNKDFAKLVNIERAIDSASHMKYEVITPDNYNRNTSYPAVFVFHGNSSNKKKAKNIWTSEVMKQSCITIFVQSYSHTNKTEYKWLFNDEKTNREFRNIYNAVIAEYAVDSSNIILSGMSAGAGVAICFAFNGLVNVKGLVLNCPVIPDIVDTDIAGFIVKNRMIGIITGEHDFALEQQQNLIRIN